MGCAWLLDRWGELRDVLERGQKWRAPDRFKAIRLLGRQPLDMDEDARVMAIYLNCSAMEPPEGLAFKDLGNELHWNEQKRFNEWAGQRGVLGRIPADAESGKAALLELVGEEEDRLEDLLAALLERPEPSVDEQAFDASEEGERLRRYQATCDRALLRVLEALRKRRKDAGGSATEGRPSARPARTREAAADPMRGMAGLLSLIAASQGKGPTNEAKRPATSPLGHGPGPREGEPPCEPQSPTNEPNLSPERAARPSPAPGLPPALLALFALFLTVVLGAAVAVGAVSESNAPPIRMSTPVEAPSGRLMHPEQPPAAGADLRNVSWFPSGFSASMARRAPIQA